jgi:hypothetical protein
MEKRRAWVVQLEAGVWHAGAAERTQRIDRAKIYRTKRGAQIGLGVARRWVDYPRAEVKPIPVGPNCRIFDELEPWPEGGEK